MEQKYNITIDELGIDIGTGSIAKQANGAVTISLGETIVFVSAVASKSTKPGQDFFPLTVDYREKYAAAGRFPGGYFKREGRPSEKEILTSRLCDRPLRSLFSKGFLNEVQIMSFLLTTDLVNEPDVLVVNGASAALTCSDIPWNGPVGCVRIGRINDEFISNPTHEQISESNLDLIYVGNEKEMMMIEGSAEEIPEDQFIAALEFAHQAIQPLITAQKKLAKQLNKAKQKFELVSPDRKILQLCRKSNENKLLEAVFQNDKRKREEGIAKLKEMTIAQLTEKQKNNAESNEIEVNMAFEVLQEEIYRDNILNKQKRVDDRAVDEIRPLSCKTDILPCIHGSALFERGETQSIVIATLGTSRDSQELDGLTGGIKSKSFFLHYNFPPYSVGECGRFGIPSRREIGHGALAERSILPVLPSEDIFPYSIRLVSEIMESNGSTSMASVCAGTLALMDAGVPISNPVAGISCGLVSEHNSKGDITKHVVLTDIIGAEDHFGDMDFKICGTKEGITGFQLDLKIHGLPFEIAKEAIYRNREAREQILKVMLKEQSKANEQLKSCAPRIEQINIDSEKIGALIGPGGKNIRRIQEITNAQIDIDESNSGKILVFAVNSANMKRAIEEIELVTAEIEPGKTYKGIVRSVKEFGVFVECLPSQEGLVHVSELADFRVDQVEDVCKLGDEILVKCIGIDEKGRVRLSRRAALAEAEGRPYEPKPRSEQNNRNRSENRSSRSDRSNSRNRRDHRGGKDGNKPRYSNQSREEHLNSH